VFAWDIFGNSLDGSLVFWAWDIGMGDGHLHTYLGLCYRNYTGIVQGLGMRAWVCASRLLVHLFLGSGKVHRDPGTHMGFGDRHAYTGMRLELYNHGDGSDGSLWHVL
jgi:hypothetical protein